MLSIPVFRNKVSDEWITKCHEWKREYPIVRKENRIGNKYVDIYYLAELLGQEMRDDEIIIPGVSGTGVEIFWHAFKLHGKQRMLNSGGLGGMGFGLPGAIGACIASGKRVISIDGDGGFQLNIQELSTVVNKKIPLIIFILNNQGYASIRNMQNSRFEGNLVACDNSSGLFLPDIIKIAEAYGMKTYKLINHDRIRENIKIILENNEPVLIDVNVDPNSQAIPKVTSILLPDGSMKSKPLEDMWPFLDPDEIKRNTLN